MKILMLTPYLPYPLLSGGQIRTYNLLKNLSKKHEITLFSLIKEEKEKKYIEQIKPFCKKVAVFKRPKSPWALRNILLAAFTPYPFVVTRNLPIGAKKVIAKALQQEQFDLIHAETFYMMPNIPNTRVPILLVEQTIEYLGYQSYVKQSRWWPLKPFLYLDVLKIFLWERYFWQKAERLVTMSEEDKQYIQKTVANPPQIDVVANGVDIVFFEKTKKRLPQEPTVLFVGTFKWLPNVDAVKLLVGKIWPKVRHDLPHARLKIVGFSPTKEILAFAQDSQIEVLGKVEDIRNAYGQSHVLLAPIRSGKGTRYKILEAMATGTPVVSTRLGVEGLDIIPGAEALVADTPEELARLTVKLLKDSKLQRRLAQAGRTLVRKRYNWQSISLELDRIYQELGYGQKG
jgi:glycosyltransferase involved in cell wall biosynthesis